MNLMTRRCNNWENTHPIAYDSRGQMTNQDYPLVILRLGESPELYAWGAIDNKWYCPECMNKITERYTRQAR